MNRLPSEGRRSGRPALPVGRASFESRRRPGFLGALRLSLAALVLIASPSAAQFKSLETRNLRLVYFGPTQSFIAPYTARCFERSLRFHSALFGYQPWEKVTVILDDTADFANAGVWCAPRNSMLVHLAPNNFVYETGPSNERINFTMNHEMLHVVALDQAAGRDRTFRTLFDGKVDEVDEHPETMLFNYLTMPRRASPRWFHEGAAVFLETWMGGGLGRAQGPYDEMVFRAMVRDSVRFYDPLGIESAGSKIDFQVGTNAYLYGTRFLTYMALTDSPEKVIEWIGRGPGSKPYFANQFHHVFGRPLSDAWQQWVQWEHTFQGANLDSVRRFPTTPYRDIATRALGSVSRAVIDSARGELLTAVLYPGKVAHIAAVPLTGGAPRFVTEIKGPALYFVSSLAIDPDTRTLFYTTDNDEWRDLWGVDLATGKPHRLIRDARIGDLAFNRRDRSLWAIRHFNGISSLVRLEPPYKEWKTLYTPTYGRDLYDLHISPDGEQMVASLAEVSGRQTLQLLATRVLMAGDTTSRMLHDFGSAIPESFVFDPSGRYLFGSSYYTGVSNIWRYDLAADSMDIVTNAETGFFRPLPVTADSLVVFRYTGQGFTPAWIEAHPLTDVSAIRFLGAEVAAQHPVVRSWVAPPPSSVNLDSVRTYAGPYRALGSVGLASWYPVVEAYKDRTSVGASFNLSDPVGFHDFQLSATYSPEGTLPDNERWHVRANYHHFQYDAYGLWNPGSFYDFFGPTKSSQKGYAYGLGYRRLLIRDEPRRLEMSLSGDGVGDLERLPSHQNVSTSAGFDKLLHGQIGLHYENLRASIGAADKETGVSWDLNAHTQGVRNLTSTGGIWRGFPKFTGELDLGAPVLMRNSSLWLRSAAGYSPGDAEEPFANFYFGGFGNNWVDHGEPKRYRQLSRFPGVEIDAVGGTSFARGLLELQLPPLRFERFGTLALYGTWARLSLFGSGLVTSPDDDLLRRKLVNAGAQTDIRFQLLTQQPLTLSFGYARAFERDQVPSEEWMVSLKIL